MLAWLGRVALELIGQGALGYSFDPLVADRSDTYADALKSLVYVSLALNTEDVEEVVYAAENARIWLTREGESVPGDPTAPVTGDSLWRRAGGDGGQG